MAAKAMVPTLDELNRYLLAWARESYERNPHEGLGGRTPLQAWEEDRAPLRRAEPVHLSGAFLLRAVRRVDKTALISVRGCRYLCADALVGAQVQVRYHPARPDQPVQVWMQDRFLQMAYPYVPPAEVPRQTPAATDRAQRDRTGRGLTAVHETRSWQKAAGDRGVAR